MAYNAARALRDNDWGARMNQERYAGMCKQLRGALRQCWGRLVNDPRAADAGARERHAGQVQARYGLAQDEAAQALREFFTRHRDWDVTTRQPRARAGRAEDYFVSDR